MWVCGCEGSWHLRKTDWRLEPGPVLNDFNARLVDAGVGNNDTVLLESGSVLPKGFLTLPVYLLLPRPRTLATALPEHAVWADVVMGVVAQQLATARVDDDARHALGTDIGGNSDGSSALQCDAQVDGLGGAPRTASSAGQPQSGAIGSCRPATTGHYGSATRVPGTSLQGAGTGDDADVLPPSNRSAAADEPAIGAAETLAASSAVPVDRELAVPAAAALQASAGPEPACDDAPGRAHRLGGDEEALSDVSMLTYIGDVACSEAASLQQLKQTIAALPPLLPLGLVPEQVRRPRAMSCCHVFAE